MSDQALERFIYAGMVGLLVCAMYGIYMLAVGPTEPPQKPQIVTVTKAVREVKEVPVSVPVACSDRIVTVEKEPTPHANQCVVTQ